MAIKVRTIHDITAKAIVATLKMVKIIIVKIITRRPMNTIAAQGTKSSTMVVASSSNPSKITIIMIKEIILQRQPNNNLEGMVGNNCKVATLRIIRDMTTMLLTKIIGRVTTISRAATSTTLTIKEVPLTSIVAVIRIQPGSRVVEITGAQQKCTPTLPGIQQTQITVKVSSHIVATLRKSSMATKASQTPFIMVVAKAVIEAIVASP